MDGTHDNEEYEGTGRPQTQTFTKVVRTGEASGRLFHGEWSYDYEIVTNGNSGDHHRDDAEPPDLLHTRGFRHSPVTQSTPLMAARE